MGAMSGARIMAPMITAALLTNRPSVAISVLIGLVTRYTQVNHAELVGHVNPYAPAMRGIGAPDLWSLAEPAGRAAFNAEITRQAAAIAYINDFWLMTWVSLASIPLIFLFRLPRIHAPPENAGAR